MKFRFLSCLLAASALLGSVNLLATKGDFVSKDEAVAAPALRVSNNHAFAIRDTIWFKLPADLAANARNLLAVSHSVAGGTVEAHYLPVQLMPAPEGEPVPAWIDVQLRPNESRLYNFQDIGGGSGEGHASIAARFDSGLPRTATWPSETETELFDLILSETSNPAEDAASLQFEFVEEKKGPVTTTLLYRANPGSAYDIEVRYDLFSSGIADVQVTLHTDRNARSSRSLTLGKVLPSPSGQRAAVGADQILYLDPGASTPARSTWGRDANWLVLGDLDDGPNRALLAAYTRFKGRLINETVTGNGDHWLMVAELGSDELAADGPIVLHYRMLPVRARTLAEVDQAFTAFAGYQERRAAAEEFHVSYGVDGVQFGTNYAPHTIFGGAGNSEPLFAETWQRYQEEIRRDFRIANAAGMKWIRVHPIESPDPKAPFLTTEDGEWMLDYLSFLGEVARETHLGLILSLTLSPSDVQLVAESLEDIPAFFELSGQTLDPDLVRQIEATRPNASVIASPDEIETLHGAKAIGRPVRLEPSSSSGTARDLVLSFGALGSRRGILPVISEAGFRQDPRQSGRERANALFAGFDAFLAQRATPVVIQSTFVDPVDGPASSDALLRLDRTPYIQGHAFHELIRRYSGPENQVGAIEVNVPVVSIRAGETQTISVRITNRGSRPLDARSRLILPEGLTSTDGPVTISLRPRQSRTIQRTITAAQDLAPGFYHLFEEVSQEDSVRFGWSFAACRRAPRMDLETEPGDGVHYAGGLESLANINLSNIRHVVFGQAAGDDEIAVARKFSNTLRSATGSPIQSWTADRLGEDEKSRSLAVIGHPATHSFLAEIAHLFPVNPKELPSGEGVVMTVPHPTENLRFILVISGRDTDGIEKAANDFIRRYWRFAKDALAFEERDGLAAND